MEGEYLKEILRKRKISISEIARRLNVPPQNLSSALSGKDIKTGVMEDVARALNESPAYFYIGDEANFANVETAINSTVIGKKDTGCSALEKQLDVKDEQIASLHRIIENMSRTGK